MCFNVFMSREDVAWDKQLLFFFKSKQLFSSNEMDRRLKRIRSHMEQEGIDACVFTSYYNMYYFSDFLYCSMGRQYGLIITDEKAITVTPCKYLAIIDPSLIEGWWTGDGGGRREYVFSPDQSFTILQNCERKSQNTARVIWLCACVR